MLSNIFDMRNNFNLYNEWKKSLIEKKPLVKNDLCLGFGVTIDRDIATNKSINNIIQQTNGNEYIWVREEGLLYCIHYTKASFLDLKKNGLKGFGKDTYTFTNGIYVYNANQHPSRSDNNYVEFIYYGEYYKCIYDPDPIDSSKDIGTTQEYLIPTLNIPYKYLTFHSKNDLYNIFERE